MVPSCMRAMISMSTRSSMCLPEHWEFAEVSYLVLSIIFGTNNEVKCMHRPNIIQVNNELYNFIKGTGNGNVTSFYFSFNNRRPTP